MQHRWSAKDASHFVAELHGTCSEEFALLVYASRLLGAEPGLVLHGGGNSSVKGHSTNLFGEAQPTLYMKGSGRDMATITPPDFAALDLSGLLRLRTLEQLTETQMAGELRRLRMDSCAPSPSIETLAHAFLPAKYVLHTHADAILVLTNQTNGFELVQAAMGSQTILLPYHRPGYALAKAVASAYESFPNARGMVWMNHGITTWGESAEKAYGQMIELVSLAEEYAEQNSKKETQVAVVADVESTARRIAQLAPILRGILGRVESEGDGISGGGIVLPVATPQVLKVLAAENAKSFLVSSPLTSDHLIRTKPLPMWLDGLNYENGAALADAVKEAVEEYGKNYQAYFQRNAESDTAPYDALPHLLLIPGAGMLATGRDMESAVIARDIGLQSLMAKSRIDAMGGTYQSPAERDLFHMEYDPFQRAKLAAKCKGALNGRTALVTGAAGAIGLGVCEELLRQGCAVAIGDLPGERLVEAEKQLAANHVGKVLAVPFDVTDPAQVTTAFAAIARAWGGLDLVVINAGIAHVAPLIELDLEAFRRLESVNVDGTLNLLSESGRHFLRQNCGGDIVLVSTKNVFAPGAGFGAYSATKAAAHQLARIASLEMASMGVRVNMVSPDAVFGHGSQRSGLWATVGPDRMRARGLDEKGLESYYQSRNLLKARVTATHVANAVIYFATRQTPTTGATIPVDGGLPDATPR